MRGGTGRAGPGPAEADGRASVAGRSQCACVAWEGWAWALGGCDAWHCLATTERLPLRAAEQEAAWEAGPPLPTARRSVGGGVWRDRLVSAGGSDGASSLRRVDWLGARAPAWRAGPDMRRARAALGLVVLHDVLYAVGGFDGKVRRGRRGHEARRPRGSSALLTPVRCRSSCRASSACTSRRASGQRCARRPRPAPRCPLPPSKTGPPRRWPPLRRSLRAFPPRLPLGPLVRRRTAPRPRPTSGSGPARRAPAPVGSVEHLRDAVVGAAAATRPRVRFYV